MALYAAIIDDAFSRLETNDNFQNHDRKRRAPGIDTPKRASKRLKGEAPATTTVAHSPDDVETVRMLSVYTPVFVLISR